MSNIKKSKSSFGSNRFAAGLIQNIYDRKLPPERIMQLKLKLASQDFKNELTRLSQGTRQEILNLIVPAEQHGALRYLISFVYGLEKEDPRLILDLKEHIKCWDNRDALIAALDAKAVAFRQKYGFEKEADELVRKAKSLDDAALSYAYDVLSGALINPEGLSREEVGQRINAAIVILNSW